MLFNFLFKWKFNYFTCIVETQNTLMRVSHTNKLKSLLDVTSKQQFFKHCTYFSFLFFIFLFSIPNWFLLLLLLCPESVACWIMQRPSTQNWPKRWEEVSAVPKCIWKKYIQTNAALQGFSVEVCGRRNVCVCLGMFVWERVREWVSEWMVECVRVVGVSVCVRLGAYVCECFTSTGNQIPGTNLLRRCSTPDIWDMINSTKLAGNSDVGSGRLSGGLVISRD